MEIKKFCVLRAEGLDFAAVCVAMNHSNIGSYIADEFRQFVREHGLEERDFVPMATHSWGGRDWALEEGKSKEDVLFFEEECFNGGWYLFTEADVSGLECSSMTSRSELSAWKNEDGTWSLKLEVPDEEGVPYQGHYWEVFHQAVQEASARESEREKLRLAEVEAKEAAKEAASEAVFSEWGHLFPEGAVPVRLIEPYNQIIVAVVTADGKFPVYEHTKGGDGGCHIYPHAPGFGGHEICARAVVVPCMVKWPCSEHCEKLIAYTLYAICKNASGVYLGSNTIWVNTPIV